MASGPWFWLSGNQDLWVAGFIPQCPLSLVSRKNVHCREWTSPSENESPFFGVEDIVNSVCQLPFQRSAKRASHVGCRMRTFLWGFSSNILPHLFFFSEASQESLESMFARAHGGRGVIGSRGSGNVSSCDGSHSISGEDLGQALMLMMTMRQQWFTLTNLGTVF